MTASQGLKTSIAKSLVIQFCAVELLSVILFMRGGFTVLGGIAAPLFGAAMPFIAIAQWSHRHSAPQMLLAGLIALALLASGFVAWLYFASRIPAHAAFTLFSLFSILLLLAELV